eukprot:SAG25_NODE_14594_length_253_cov_0.662338_1_plen_26_part_01
MPCEVRLVAFVMHTRLRTHTQSYNML